MLETTFDELFTKPINTGKSPVVHLRVDFLGEASVLFGIRSSNEASADASFFAVTDMFAAWRS